MGNVQLIRHNNYWWWGQSVTIIANNGMGMVNVGIDKKYPTVGFVKDLMVHETCQKQGLGQRLLNAAEMTAKIYERHFVQLNVNKNVLWLIEWYEQNGYTIIYDDDDEYIMWKDLMK